MNLRTAVVSIPIIMCGVINGWGDKTNSRDDIKISGNRYPVKYPINIINIANDIPFFLYFGINKTDNPANNDHVQASQYIVFVTLIST